MRKRVSSSKKKKELSPLPVHSDAPSLNSDDDTQAVDEVVTKQQLTPTPSTQFGGAPTFARRALSALGREDPRNSGTSNQSDQHSPRLEKKRQLSPPKPRTGVMTAKVPAPFLDLESWSRENTPTPGSELPQRSAQKRQLSPPKERADVKRPAPKFEPEPTPNPPNQTPSRGRTERRYESLGGRWDLTAVGAKLLDESGVPHSRTECEDQLMKIRRHDKELDIMPIVDLAYQALQNSDETVSAKLSLTLAAVLQVINDQRQKIKHLEDLISHMGEEEALIETGKGFSIDHASDDEGRVVLPTGNFFKMSEFVEDYNCCTRSSSDFDRHAKAVIRQCLSSALVRDPFYCAFSSSDSSTKYVPLSDDFFSAVASFVIKGFLQPYSRTLKTKVVGMTRSVLSNFLDRERQKYNGLHKKKEAAEELGQELREKLKEIGEEPIGVELRKRS